MYHPNTKNKLSIMKKFLLFIVLLTICAFNGYAQMEGKDSLNQTYELIPCDVVEVFTSTQVAYQDLLDLSGALIAVMPTYGCTGYEGEYLIGTQHFSHRYVIYVGEGYHGLAVSIIYNFINAKGYHPNEFYIL